jgi:hypothetical protein
MLRVAGHIGVLQNIPNLSVFFREVWAIKFMFSKLIVSKYSMVIFYAKAKVAGFKGSLDLIVSESFPRANTLTGNLDVIVRS